MSRDYEEHDLPTLAIVNRDYVFEFNGTLRAGSEVVVRAIYTDGMNGDEASCRALPGTPDLSWTHRKDGVHNIVVPCDALEFTGTSAPSALDEVL